MQLVTSTLMTTVQQEQSNEWITIHCRSLYMQRLLGHSFLGRSTDRLEPELLLKFQVALSPVRSAAGRSKTGHVNERLSRTQGHSAAGRCMSFRISNNTIGNRIRHLSACSAGPQPMAPPRAHWFSNIPVHCSASFLIILSNVYKYCARFLYILF